jgi:solute carrier family 25 carnitine/acylcarnitine transporter 20/29
MSASAVKHVDVPPRLVDAPDKSPPLQQHDEKRPKAYRGFVGGVFSGIAKLSGAHLIPYTKNQKLTHLG